MHFLCRVLHLVRPLFLGNIAHSGGRHGWMICAGTLIICMRLQKCSFCLCHRAAVPLSSHRRRTEVHQNKRSFAQSQQVLQLAKCTLRCSRSHSCSISDHCPAWNGGKYHHTEIEASQMRDGGMDKTGPLSRASGPLPHRSSWPQLTLTSRYYRNLRRPWWWLPIPLTCSSTVSSRQKRSMIDSSMISCCFLGSDFLSRSKNPAGASETLRCRCGWNRLSV